MDKNTIDVDLTENIAPKHYSWAAQQKGYSIYHTQEWHRFLENTFGWHIQAIVGTAGEQTALLVPFVTKKRLVTKTVNISLPFSHDVPLLADNDTKLDSFFEKGFPLESIEIHHKHESRYLHTTKTGTLVKLNLRGKSADDVFEEFNESSIQRKIKKSQKSGVKVREENTESAYVTFGRMQAETRKRQGSPTYPLTFFKNLFNALATNNLAHLYFAYIDDEPVAGIIFFHFKDKAIYAYGASVTSQEYFRLGVNQIAMWEAIKDAISEGLSSVDFGTTPVEHTSLLDYKLKWGGTAKPFYKSYFSKDENYPEENRNNLYFKLASTILKNSPDTIFKYISPIMLKSAA